MHVYVATHKHTLGHNIEYVLMTVVKIVLKFTYALTVALFMPDFILRSYVFTHLILTPDLRIFPIFYP